MKKLSKIKITSLILNLSLSVLLIPATYGKTMTKTVTWLAKNNVNQTLTATVTYSGTVKVTAPDLPKPSAFGQSTFETITHYRRGHVR